MARARAPSSAACVRHGVECWASVGLSQVAPFDQGSCSTINVPARGPAETGHALSSKLTESEYTSSAFAPNRGRAACGYVRLGSGPVAPEGSPNDVRSSAPMAWAIETSILLLSWAVEP